MLVSAFGYQYKFILFPGFIKEELLYNLAVGGGIIALICIIIFYLLLKESKNVRCLLLFVYGSLNIAVGCIVLINTYVYHLVDNHGADICIIGILPLLAGSIMVIQSLIVYEIIKHILNCIMWLKNIILKCCKKENTL